MTLDSTSVYEKSAPHVSTIIPTFNNLDTLPGVINCVLGQTFTDLEIIVVNDAGVDPREYVDIRDPRLTFVDLKENKGVSAARNYGFSISRGRIIHFLDSDDYISSNFYDIMVHELDSGGYNAASSAQITVPIEDIGTTENIFDNTVEQVQTSYYLPEKFFHIFSKESGKFIPSATLLRREAIIKRLGTSPWNESLRNGEDTLLFLDFSAEYGMAYITEPLVVYTFRAGSLSKDQLASWSGRIEAMDLLVARMEKEEKSSGMIKVAKGMRNNAARRVARILATSNKKSEGLKVIISDIRKHPNIKSLLEIVRIYSPFKI